MIEYVSWIVLSIHTSRFVSNVINKQVLRQCCTLCLNEYKMKLINEYSDSLCLNAGNNKICYNNDFQ